MKTAMMIDGRPFITSIRSCTGRVPRRPAYSLRKSAISTPIGIASKRADADDDAGADQVRTDTFRFPLGDEVPADRLGAVTDHGDDHDDQHRHCGHCGGDGEELGDPTDACRRRRLPVATSGWVGSKGCRTPRRLISSPHRRCRIGSRPSWPGGWRPHRSPAAARRGSRARRCAAPRPHWGTGGR